MRRVRPVDLVPVAGSNTTGLDYQFAAESQLQRGITDSMTNSLFDELNGPGEDQTMLDIDDGTGLRVVSARFESESKFDWDVFSGYDSLRVLTYSVSVDAIVRMLDRY